MSDAQVRGTMTAAPMWEEMVSAFEALFIVTFLLAYIWIIEPWSRAYAGPGFVLFFAFTLLIHIRHGDTAAELGIRLDTFGRAAGEALLEDERRFIDLARSPLFVAEEHPIVA